MENTIKLFVLILILVCPSCRSKRTAKNKVRSLYCTNDILVAEKALLEGLQALPRYEAEHIEGVDFNAIKALYHERLFLIYRKLGETNRMTSEFQLSMEYLGRSRHRWGEPPPPTMNYDEFAQKLDWRERGLPVNWKTSAGSNYHIPTVPK